jgi:hypothetical protein
LDCHATRPTAPPSRAALHRWSAYVIDNTGQAP